MNWLQKISGLSDDALSRLHQTGNQVVEEAIVGSYELYLILLSNDFIQLYQLAIQRTGLDFTDIQQQNEQQELPENAAAELANLNEMAAVITRWKQQYGDLAVKSHDPSKDAKYLNILQWLGFTPTTRDVMGTQVIYI